MSANAIDLFAGVNVAPPTGNGQVLIATGAGTAGWGNTIGAGGLSVAGGVTVSSGNLGVTLGNVNTAFGTVNAITIAATGGVSAVGNMDVTGAGSGLRVAEGSNAKQGTAILSGGTILVPNTSVTATSRIVCGLVSLGTVTVPSALGVSARVAGTSFTILASQATDTSTVWYEIFEPG